MDYHSSAPLEGSGLTSFSAGHIRGASRRGWSTVSLHATYLSLSLCVCVCVCVSVSVCGVCVCVLACVHTYNMKYGV